MNKGIMLTPGPTPLPPAVLQAMSQQIIHHRTKEFGNTSTSRSARCSTSTGPRTRS